MARILRRAPLSCTRIRRIALLRIRELQLHGIHKRVERVCRCCQAFHRLRQSAIDEELSEVVSGFEDLKWEERR